MLHKADGASIPQAQLSTYNHERACMKTLRAQARGKMFWKQGVHMLLQLPACSLLLLLQQHSHQAAAACLLCQLSNPNLR